MDYSTLVSRQSGLSGADVMDMRYLHDFCNYNDAQLARMFNVTRKAVYNIVNRRVWRQVPSATTVKGYSNYAVFPDGRVLSKATGRFLTAIPRTAGPAVRLTKANGTRETIPVSTLLKKAKFA